MRRPLLALCCAWPLAAWAQPSLPRSSAWQLESYRTAAQGLLREEACRSLSSAERREFAWHLERIEAGLAGEWGVEALASAVAWIQAMPVPECGGEAAAEARAALDKARDFSAVLRGLAFSPDALHLADAGRLVRLVVVQRRDDRCRVFPPGRRARLDADVEALGRRLAEEIGPAARASIEESADRLSAQTQGDAPALDCAELAGPALERMLAEASRAAAQ